MARDRSVAERVGDWAQAFRAVQEELTPLPLRAMMTTLVNSVPPAGSDDLDQVRAYIERVNAAGGVSRLVFANDRAAAVVAGILTQSGVTRPNFDVIEGGEA